MGDIEHTMGNARARVLVVDGDENVGKVMVRVLGRAHDVSPLPSAEEVRDHLARPSASPALPRSAACTHS